MTWQRWCQNLVRREMDETSLYLFCGRRADHIKALYWDGTGYILLYKRLTKKRFQ